MRVTETQVDVAYRKLKSFVYYDKTDLRLRAKLAEFECSENFQFRLASILNVVNAEKPAAHKLFRRCINDIGFRLGPKALKPTPLEKADVKKTAAHGRFITNVTTVPVIEVEKVNYFFGHNNGDRFI